MIPGLFDGMFGNSPFGKATEMALEMCILEEMEKDSKRRSYDWLDDKEDDEV